jgi:hypothetical protein
MKKFFLLTAIIVFFSQVSFAQNITISTSPVAASNISQGSTNNIVYIARVDVASLPVTINAIQFTLTGTHDNNDLTVFQVFFNVTAPKGNYTQFYLAGNKKYLSAKTMKEYGEILLQHNFIRIHKSHLVNRAYIKSYQNEGSVLLTDKTSLPVSRQRKQEVAAALKG